MKKARQDAWSKEEDHYLAKMVLHHISEGETQLEAFKKAAQRMSRTPAACGFRWNAEVRKQYLDEINKAKANRKQSLISSVNKSGQEDSIDSVITLLERVKAGETVKGEKGVNTEIITKLTQENDLLQQRIKRYEDAWLEMGKLWEWIYNSEEKRNER